MCTSLYGSDTRQAVASRPSGSSRDTVCTVSHLDPSSAIVPGFVGVADFFGAVGPSSGVASSAEPFGEPPAPRTTVAYRAVAVQQFSPLTYVAMCPA